MRLALPYEEPLPWAAMLAYWSKRAIPGVERVESGTYYRTVGICGCSGWFSAKARGGLLNIHVSPELSTCLPLVSARIRRAFDLDATTEPIASVLRSCPLLSPLLLETPGLRVPGAFDGFELAVRAILGQQVTVAAASTLAGRLVQRFSRAASDSPAGLTHYPFAPEDIAESKPALIARIGIPAARAATIRELARAVASGWINLDGSSEGTGVLQRLEEVPGIGPWTRDYIAMNILRRPDAFPSGDLGLCKATGLAPRALEQRSDAWRPWRAYAAMYLWTQPHGAKS